MTPGCPFCAPAAPLSTVDTAHPLVVIISTAAPSRKTRKQNTHLCLDVVKAAALSRDQRAKEQDLAEPGAKSGNSEASLIPLSPSTVLMSSSFTKPPHPSQGIPQDPLPNEDPKAPMRMAPGPKPNWEGCSREMKQVMEGWLLGGAQEACMVILML